MTKYYVDAHGNYLGGFDGAQPPDRAIEVPYAPESAADRWNGKAWEKNTNVKQAAIRAARDSLLASADWTQIQDSPLTDAEKIAWADYRQALRDVPEQAGFPDTVDWPIAPRSG